ncbi:MAG: sigma-70 family RNA polymerase sigma factor [Bacteroidales bacterium]|nr:sigma-70 family RNA polymerase sigma factor [Bacteroidales bacterium]
MMNSEFEITYRSNYHRLFRIAAKMLCDTDAARDVVHDVFMAYYFVLNDKKVIKDTKNWLIRCTINKGVDFLRKNKKIVSDGNIVKENNAIQSIDNQIDLISISNLISKLDAQDQSLVVLYSEGYSYKEIAEITNINFNSVGKTLSRILEKLRRDYETL